MLIQSELYKCPFNFLSQYFINLLASHTTTGAIEKSQDFDEKLFHFQYTALETVQYVKVIQDAKVRISNFVELTEYYEDSSDGRDNLIR